MIQEKKYTSEYHWHNLNMGVDAKKTGSHWETKVCKQTVSGSVPGSNTNKLTTISRNSVAINYEGLEIQIFSPRINQYGRTTVICSNTAPRLYWREKIHGKNNAVGIRRESNEFFPKFRTNHTNNLINMEHTINSAALNDSETVKFS